MIANRCPSDTWGKSEAILVGGPMPRPSEYAEDKGIIHLCKHTSG